MTHVESGPLLSEHELTRYVRLVDSRIIVLRGVKDSTSGAVDQLFARAAKLAAGIEEPILIASLADAGLPGAAARVRIQHNIEEIGFSEIGLVFQDNTLVRVATRFILASMRFNNAHVFSTLENALAFFRQDNKAS